jgi:RNA polymerase sigma factor (sigma-70 family)
VDASVESLLAHRGWVRTLASALAQPADADDLEQEAWLAALERPPADEAPRAWLATVLRRTASNMRRTLARRGARERAAARPEAVAAEDLVALAETHERVVRAVLALPEPYRSTILLRFFEGLSPTEIARRTTTPLDTVKARLRRGLARLRGEGRSWSAVLLAPGALAMTLKTKLAIAGVAILALGSLLTYRALEEVREPERAPSARGLAIATTGPDQADALAATELGTSAPEAPSLPAERRDVFLVKGVVRGARGFMPFALDASSGERRLLGFADYSLGADGSFAVHISPVGAQAPLEIEFGVSGHGFVRQSRRIVAEPGGEYRADFDVGPGVGIAGAVADPDGRPVPGIAVFAIARKEPPQGLASRYLLDIERLLVADEHFARGDTDALGRFEIKGLMPGTYGLYSWSEDWILEHDLLVAPEGDARVTAFPAHAVTGTVRDARTGGNVASASVIVTLKTPSGWGCTKAAAVRDGLVWVVWKPQGPEVEEGFDATVAVEATGYHAAERVLRFPKDTRRVATDFLLDPVEAEKLALLRIEVTDTRGRMVAEELFPVLSAAGERPTTTEFGVVAPGIFELRAPAGSWSLRLAPRRGMGEPLAWSGTVELGRDEVLRCTLPAFGVIRLRHAGAESWIAEAEAPGGNHSYGFEVEGEEIRLVAVPGEWKIGRDDQEPRTIVVHDGVETAVDLE